MLSKLRTIQTRESWTDAQMASRLGIARTTWADVRNERIPLSERVQLMAVRAFPELMAELLKPLSTEAVA